MTTPSSPELPAISDPALIGDWDQLDQYTTIPPPSTYSDELEVLRLTYEESIVKKNKKDKSFNIEPGHLQRLSAVTRITSQVPILLFSSSILGLHTNTLS